MPLTSSTGRTRFAVAILSFLLFAMLTLLFAFARQPVSAGSAQSSEEHGRGLIIGLHPANTSALTALSPAALAPNAIQASRPLFQQSGVYHDPQLDAPIAREHIYRLQLAPGADMQAVMFNLRQQPGVAFVEPDYIAHQIAVPNDPRYGEQWGLHKINADDAWDVQTGNGSTIIALIDAGIDDDHPDLSARLWTNPGETANNGIDDDNNGYIDDVNGWNFYGDNDDLADSTGHGTQVAGLIAAAGNNNTGVSGVCWNCQIMVLKVIQPGGNANYSDIAEAIDYAAAKGAHVINLSLGGNADSAALRTAIAAASSSVLVAGAGNDNNAIPFYPAAYDSVLAVAGTDEDDVRVSSSNYGPWVDLSAPGNDVLTTFDGGSYGLADGTSLAAPFASGTAALLHAEFAWSPALIRAHLMQTAAPIAAANPGYEDDLGAGRLDAGAALTTPATPDLVVQTVTVDGRVAGQPEPGTTVDLQLTLTNQWAPTGPLQATLSSNDAYATVAQASAAFPAIGTYGSSQNNTPFRLTVAPGAPYGHTLNLRLTLRHNGATIQTIPVRVTVAQQVVNVSGVISSDTTWSGDRVYRLTGNVVVAAGATLTVEAGARVEAEADRVLRVQGELIATGTEEAPVVFTSSETIPSVGDWTGIEVVDSGSISLIACEISYAFRGIYIRSNGAQAHAIQYCTLRNNHQGIFSSSATSSHMTVSNSRIIYNTTVGVQGAVMPDEANVTIQDSEVTYNETGILYGDQVTGNLIHHNYGTTVPDPHNYPFGGAGIIESKYVHGNIVVNNTLGVVLGFSAILTANNIHSNIYYDAFTIHYHNLTVPENWWGTTNLNAINAKVFDFGEDVEMGIVDVQPILTGPSTVAPAYLYDMDVTPDTTIGIQEATLDLKFSGAMDESHMPQATVRMRSVIPTSTDPGSIPGLIEAMAVAPDGVLWITTRNELMSYDGADLTIYPAPSFSPYEYIVQMDVDRNGDVWVVPDYRPTARVLRFDGNEWMEYNIAGELTYLVSDVAADPVAGIWLAHEGGVTYFDGSSATTYLIDDTFEYIEDVEVAPDGTVWAVDSWGYVHRFHEGLWTTFDLDGITCECFFWEYLELEAVAADEAWINYYGRLYQYDGSIWTRHTVFPPNPVNFSFAIKKIADGTVLASSDNHLIRYDGSKILPAPSLPGADNIRSIVETANGTLWFGTNIGAVQYYETPLAPGFWLDNTTYRITHPVTAAMPRGEYDLTVSGAIDASGRQTPPMTLPAFTVDYAGEVADGTAPPRPSLTVIGVEGDASGVFARWTAGDPDSPIIAYRYAIGTTRGGREIVNWTTTTATQLSRSNFGFVEGHTYYFTLQAQNSGGLWSPSATGSFIAGQGYYENFLPALWGR